MRKVLRVFVTAVGISIEQRYVLKRLFVGGKSSRTCIPVLIAILVCKISRAGGIIERK
jgi:hypothetical protein